LAELALLQAYYLANKCADSKEEIYRRLRSIPRKHHPSLNKELFCQDPAKNHAIIRGVQMQPTLGLQIILSMQGKTLSKAYNLTRQMLVGAAAAAAERYC